MCTCMHISLAHALALPGAPARTVAGATFGLCKKKTPNIFPAHIGGVAPPLPEAERALFGCGSRKAVFPEVRTWYYTVLFWYSIIAVRINMLLYSALLLLWYIIVMIQYHFLSRSGCCKFTGALLERNFRCAVISVFMRLSDGKSMSSACLALRSMYKSSFLNILFVAGMRYLLGYPPASSGMPWYCMSS